MRNNDNNLIISRNETFTMDRVVQNRDGSPYIVSSQLNNPHILITVSSSKYRQANRYLKRFYLPIPKELTFHQTNPINIKDIAFDADSNSLNDFPTDLELSMIQGKWTFMSGYYAGNFVTFELNDAIFYKENDDGTVSYKRWVPEELQNGYSGEWVDYKFRFVKTFDSNFTSELVEQTYYYTIELIAGRDLKSYLISLCESYFVEFTDEDDAQTLYDKLLNKGVELNVGADELVVFHDYLAPLMETRTISVMSNLKGGML